MNQENNNLQSDNNIFSNNGGILFVLFTFTTIFTLYIFFSNSQIKELFEEEKKKRKCKFHICEL